ncbi:MAG: DUF3147 family protein [Candidatus Omnitrophica bacterium]|nr:DUF3147 family protein [Candidatus Omnitrophota bacterium]
MWFISKILISSFIVAFASWLAGKKSFLAGFIVALPITSILSLLFAYVQYRDMQKINEFAISILISVPLSLLFFVPFVFNKWLHMNFVLSFCCGIFLLAVAFVIHQWLFKTNILN